jgi:hypothetical protein
MFNHHIKEGQPMTATNSSRKTSPKKASRYYLVRTIDQAGNAVAESVDNTRQKLVVEPLTQSKALIADLRKAPRKTVTGWVNEGKDTIREMRTTATDRLGNALRGGEKALKNPRRTVAGIVEDGKTAWSDLKADGRKTIDGFTQSGRTLLQGLETDIRLVVSEAKEAGKTAAKKIDIRESVQDRLNQSMQRVPQVLNLPSRREIEALNGSMAEVVAQVESIKTV